MWLFRLVSVVFILCFGSSASAECAWILWTQEVEMYAESSRSPMPGMHREQSEWRIFHVVQTMLECQKELASFIDREQRLENKPFTIPKENKGSVYKKYANPRPGELSSTIDYLLCLPDTVDPRERKQ